MTVLRCPCGCGLKSCTWPFFVGYEYRRLMAKHTWWGR